MNKNKTSRHARSSFFLRRTELIRCIFGLLKYIIFSTIKNIIDVVGAHQNHLAKFIPMRTHKSYDFIEKYIRITCPCVLYPLTPHYYILKLGFAGVYIIFLFLL